MKARDSGLITWELRCKIIDYINQQDVFRLSVMFDELDIDVGVEVQKSKLKKLVNGLVSKIRREGYIQRVEAGRYITLSEIPHEIYNDGKTEYKEPRI